MSTRYFIITFIFLLFPQLLFANGMFFGPSQIHIEQAGQNAIVAWNNGKEGF